MNGLSVNRACSAGAAFLGGISLIALAAIFLLTKNPMIVWLGLLFIALCLPVSFFLSCFSAASWFCFRTVSAEQ